MEVSPELKESHPTQFGLLNCDQKQLILTVNFVRSLSEELNYYIYT